MNKYTQNKGKEIIKKILSEDSAEVWYQNQVGESMEEFKEKFRNESISN